MHLCLRYLPLFTLGYTFVTNVRIHNFPQGTAGVDITVSPYEEHSSLKITCARLYIPGEVLTCSNISMASNSLPSFINAPPMARRTDWTSALTSCS